MKNPSNISSGESDERAVSVTEWIRNNYQDHTTVDSLCDALDRFRAAIATQPAPAEPVARTGSCVDKYNNCLASVGDYVENELVEFFVGYISPADFCAIDTKKPWRLKSPTSPMASCITQGNYSASAKTLRFVATPPAAPAATEAPSEPFGWFIELEVSLNPKAGPVYLGGGSKEIMEQARSEGDGQPFPLYATPAPAVGASVQPVLASLSDDDQAELVRLRAIINTPQADDFLRAVSTEAEHQRQRWGSDHDAGKTPADWFWLVGYLAGKALHAHAEGNAEKAEHHIITTGAACANWHLALFGKTSMRPGIDAATQPESGVKP